MRGRAWFSTTAAAALLTACTGTPPHADTPVRYVALGDSYTSAPGIGTGVGTPPGCDRSDNNYPRLVAAELPASEFTDASCGGATTEHLTRPQRTAEGSNPPQLSAVAPDTTLVTIGIGGNDVGLVELAAQCADVPAEDGVCGEEAAINDRIPATASDVSSVLAKITAKAPDARVLVVGYPTILPADLSTCSGALPHDPADLSALREGLELLNHILEEQANAHGAEFVNTAAATEGHDLCAPEDSRWIAGLAPADGGAALHPTARGERAMAQTVLAVLRGH